MQNLTQIRKAVLKKSKGKYMAQIPQKEIVEAMKELSANAYKLLMYYYSRRDGWRFDDENIANAIGTSARQVKKARRELISQGYLLIQKGEVDVYFIGKKAVKQFKEGIIEDDETDEPQEPIIVKTHNDYVMECEGKEPS